MKLLYLLNSITNSGGMERIVVDKINYLAEQAGYQIALAYFGSNTDEPFFPIDKKIKLFPLRLDPENASFLSKIAIAFKLRSLLCDVIRKVHPDVIVDANMKVVSWILLSVNRNIPKIIELHFSYEGLQIMNREIYGNNYIKSSFNNILRKSFYPLFDRCVVLTEEDRQDWGFKNIDVIPNFSNVQFRESSECFLKQKLAVNIGRLTFQKNQKLLIKAWAIVHKQEPEWILEIWGDGEMKEELADLIYSLDLTKTVFLKGVSSDIEKVYRKASFFVLSSIYEGQPLVMIEALQSGLPCVCTAVNGVRGIILEGYNGYIINQHTPHSLAEGIIRMIRNDNRIDMSQNARMSSLVFEKTNIMEKWKNLFNELVYENCH